MQEDRKLKARLGCFQSWKGKTKQNSKQQHPYLSINDIFLYDLYFTVRRMNGVVGDGWYLARQRLEECNLKTCMYKQYKRH